MAEDQDQTTPMSENPEPQQPTPAEPAEPATAATSAAEPAPASEPAPMPVVEPVPVAEPVSAPADESAPAPYASPTPPPPPMPEYGQQAQPTQPYQAASPYGQPQQPYAPGQPVNSFGQPVDPFGQSMPGYYQQPVVVKSGKATGALVCGIFAILFSWLPLFGIILGIIAIVLAVKAVKEAGKDGKATGGKVCGILGIVFSVLAFLMWMVIGFGAFAYVAAHPESVTVTGNEFSYSGSSATSTDEEAQAEAAAQVELDKIKNGDAAFVQKLATDLDEYFVGGAEFSLTELGVDPAALAQWLLVDFDYQLDGAYTYDDGTGTVYADVTMRDAYALTTAFMVDAEAFSSSAEVASMDEAAVKAKLGELFNAAMENTTDTTTSYTSVDVVKKDGIWTADQEAWEESVDSLFGIY